jgi:hypothetical protein
MWSRPVTDANDAPDLGRPTRRGASDISVRDGWEARQNAVTKREAIKWVKAHDDDDNLDPQALEEAFLAIYGRPPDDQDREEGLWSHLCAAVFS